MCVHKSSAESAFLEVSSPCPGVVMTSSLPCRETHAENRPSAAGVHVPGLHVAEDESDGSSSQVRQKDERALDTCLSKHILKCTPTQSEICLPTLIVGVFIYQNWLCPYTGRDTEHFLKPTSEVTDQFCSMSD